MTGDPVRAKPMERRGKEWWRATCPRCGVANHRPQGRDLETWTCEACGERMDVDYPDRLWS